MFPCNHAIWSKWAPSMERTTLVSIAVTGISLLSFWPITGLNNVEISITVGLTLQTWSKLV